MYYTLIAKETQKHSRKTRSSYSYRNEKTEKTKTHINTITSDSQQKRSTMKPVIICMELR